MTTSTITLNPGTGGDKPAVDTLTTVDGVAAPAGALAQLTKLGWGAANIFNTASAATPVPMTALGNSIISTANSSVAALGISATFTGTAEDVTEYLDARVYVFADQASATDGLQLQQSSNGTNWDVIDSYTIPANTGKTFSVAITAKFFRLVYINGATANTVFRWQTKYGKSYSKGSSVRPQDGRSIQNDMEEMLAYLNVWNGTNFDMLRGDATNGARMQMTPVISATVLSAANTAATLTLTAPGAGLFHYLTRIRITNHNTSAAAVVGSAVTLAYTSTNIPGALAWTEGNALAAGTSKIVIDEVLENAIKVTAAALATTIVSPAAGAGVLTRITAYFYTGP